MTISSSIPVDAPRELELALRDIESMYEILACEVPKLSSSNDSRRWLRALYRLAQVTLTLRKVNESTR